jgi:hypothetical protein
VMAPRKGAAGGARSPDGRSPSWKERLVVSTATWSSWPTRQGAAGGAEILGRALAVAAQEICVLNLMCTYLCDRLICMIRVMNEFLSSVPHE